MKKTLAKGLALAFAGSMLFAGSAFALPVLTITDGSNIATFTDSTEDGTILSGSLDWGNWTVYMTTALTAPETSTDTNPEMDLISVNATSLGAGILTVTFTDDTLGPLDTGLQDFIAGLGCTTDGNVSVVYNIFDSANILYDTTTLSMDHISGTGILGDADILNSPVGTFTLQMIATISHYGSGENTNLTATLDPVPEPATMLLMGSGLAGLAGVARKRRKKV